MKFIEKYWTIITLVIFLTAVIKFSLGLLLFGSLIFYIAIQLIIFQKFVFEKGLECTGTILEYRQGEDGDKAPLIEFTTLKGELIKEQPFVYTSTDLSAFRSYKKFINQPVLILYDPDDPKKFVIKNESGFNYIFAILLLLICTICMALSICDLTGYIHIGK